MSNNTIDPIVVYIKERITFIPWGILPVLLFLIGHGNTQYHFILLYNLLWGIFFFRVFDDYFCFDYDKENKQRPYLENGKKPLLILMFVFGILFLSSSILMYEVIASIILFGVLFLSVFLYLLLKNKKEIILVSMLKYPLLLWLVAFYSNEQSMLWIICGSLFFIVREVIEEFYHQRNRQIEMILMFLLIGSKILVRLV